MADNCADLEFLDSGELKSTMHDETTTPLLLKYICNHGAQVNPNGKIHSCTGDGMVTTTYGEHLKTAYKLAFALQKAGVKISDRIGTIAFSHIRHFALYHAVTCMGAVLNPLNVRLHQKELGYIINHASDKLIFIDEALVGKLKAVDADFLKTVELVVVMGDNEGPTKGKYEGNWTTWEAFLETGEDGKEYPWPDLNENAAVTLCYTSGTTGNPKGVLYSQRAIYLHTWGLAAGPIFGLTHTDVLFPLVPMFHVMGWGIPFLALMFGIDIAFPHRHYKAESLGIMFAKAKVTIAFGVPAIWQGLKTGLQAHPEKFSFLKGVLTRLTVGGSAVPLDLINFFWKEWGVEIIQGWGMTETGPIGSISRHINRGSDVHQKTEEERCGQQAFAGIKMPGLSWKICNPEKLDEEVPQDGKSVGELMIKGPWVTRQYFRNPAPDKFIDGYLLTGDVSSIQPTQTMKIEDRSKDLIKSGGEWISSVDMENLVVALDSVELCAVVGVPHPKWVQRPIVIVQLVKGKEAPSLEEVQKCLSVKFAKFQLPDDVLTWEEIPKTGTGKISKKLCREKLKKEDYKLPEKK